MKSKLHVVEGGKKPSIFRNLEALRIPPDDEDGPEEALQPPHKRRRFRRFDEIWAERLLTADPLPSREALLLALVLVTEADFKRHITVATAITKAARLTRFNKRAALGDLERLGLVRVEWRGRGKAPIVTPLLLDRPRRK